MREQIITDTTTSVSPIYISEGDEDTDGWHIQIVCPVHGKSIMPIAPMDTREKALEAIATLF